MTADELLQVLGYDRSPRFLRGDDLAYSGAHGHAFRQAQGQLGLRGAYVLHPATGVVSDGSAVPLVYVCEAHDPDEADRIHRLVWNQIKFRFLLFGSCRELVFFFSFLLG